MQFSLPLPFYISHFMLYVFYAPPVLASTYPSQMQMPFPECTIDVDTLNDLEIVTWILAGREKSDEQ